MANLNKIPKTGATVIVGAPKVGKATGGFTRILAVW
jgi:kynurenine formamidase